MLEDLKNFIDGILEGITNKRKLLILEETRNGLLAERYILLEKVQSLNDVIYQSSKTSTEKAEKIVELQNQLKAKEGEIAEYSTRIDVLNSSIDSLKTELAITGELYTATPEFLDPKGSVYLPYRQIIGEKGNIQGFKLTDPRDIYATFQFQKDLLKNKGWKKLSKAQKLMSIWGWVCDYNVRTYTADYGDNWQLAVDTYYRKTGDCEDSSVLFVTICRLAGLSPSEVFVAVGPTSFGYHAYPVVYMDTDELGELFKQSKQPGWYIFESTLVSRPDLPKALQNSQYFIDAGLQNWQHYGAIKDGYKGQFNGSGAKATGASTKPHRIVNTIDKREAIHKYWKVQLKK